MSHMHGLGDIGTAKIDDRGLSLTGIRRAQFLVTRQIAQRRAQHGIADIQIDEAGTGDFNLGEARILFQPRDKLLVRQQRIE